MGGLVLTAILLQGGATLCPHVGLSMAGQGRPGGQDEEQGSQGVGGILSDLEGVDLEGGELQPLLQRAFEAFQAGLDAFRGQEALALAEAMHRRAEATWSAFCLEGILRRMGEYDRAGSVLRAHLAGLSAGKERTDTVVRLAILCAGAGWAAEERGLLGRALVDGSPDAYQILGLHALSGGDMEGARVLFRSLIESAPGGPGPGSPWALRGWGLALLPPAAEPLRGAGH